MSNGTPGGVADENSYICEKEKGKKKKSAGKHSDETAEGLGRRPILFSETAWYRGIDLHTVTVQHAPVS